jgi:glycerol-3-phosphate dehydrogenase subunit C
MPNLDGGDIEAAQKKVRANLASLGAELEKGHRLVTLQPTCSYMIRKEWPDLVDTEEARRVAAASIDVMELLEQQRRDKSLMRDFQRGFGRIAYHAACHLRAQKVGFPATRVLRLLPDTEVEVVEQCSAVDGTWGMKSQHYEMGRRYAQKLVRGVDQLDPQVVVTDCALAGQRLRGETSREPLHPVEALAQAYGIGPGV